MLALTHAMDAESGIAHGHFQSIGEPADSPVGGVDVEGELSAREVSGVQVPQDDAGIRHGGFGTAAGIAGRTRVRSGRSGDRPADRRPGRATRCCPPPAPIVLTSIIGTRSGQVFILASVVVSGRPVPNQRDVAAGPAHVEGDDVPAAAASALELAADDTRGRTREQKLHRARQRVLGGGDTAPRLNDLQTGVDAGRAQLPAEYGQIGVQHRLDVGIECRDDRPLVLPEERVDVAGERGRSLRARSRE